MRIGDLKAALEKFDNMAGGETYSVQLMLRSGAVLRGEIHNYKEACNVWLDVPDGDGATLPTSVSVECIEAIQMARI